MAGPGLRAETRQARAVFWQKGLPAEMIPDPGSTVRRGDWAQNREDKGICHPGQAVARLLQAYSAFARCQPGG